MDLITGLVYEVEYLPIDSRKPKTFVAQYLYSTEEAGRTRLNFSGRPVFGDAWVYEDQVSSAKQTTEKPAIPRRIQ